MALPISRIESMIDEYSALARECHQLSSTNFKTAKERLKNKITLAHKQRTLASNRRSIACQASIKYNLAQYQQDNRGNNSESAVEDDARFDRMEAEPHHPTYRLVRNMWAAGDIAPDNNCSAHHIVEGHGKRIKDKITGEYVQSPVAVEARLTLHEARIGINDPDNGVWLPKNMKFVPHWAMPKALPHSIIHTRLYEEFVLGRIRGRTDEAEVRTALDVIAAGLQDGELTSFLRQASLKQYSKKVGNV